MIDRRHIRLGNGSELQLRGDIEDFRVHGDDFVTREQYLGNAYTVGRASETGRIIWEAKTDPKTRIDLDPSQTVVTLPHGSAHLPGRLRSLIQDGRRFVVSVSPEDLPLRNVFCFDDRGRELWQIGEVEGDFPVGLYAAIDVSTDGTIAAMNKNFFTATVDSNTGTILHVKRGAW